MAKQGSQRGESAPARQMIMVGMNVLEAAHRRLDIVFRQFDNIYVSFSGGKDSGALLNLVIDYMRTRGITRRIGVFHQDFEAQYSATTDYVTKVMTSNLDVIDPYWVCLPMRCKTSTSMHEQYWTPWEEAKKDLWVRPRPDHPGVISVDANPFEWWTPDILQEDLYRAFAPWYHRVVGGGRGRTVGLVGIRASESLNRWRAVSGGVNMHDGLPWTTRTAPDVFSAYPIYDWSVEDVWTANARFGWPYNRLYDLFHLAGLSPHEMRVASPFNEWGMGSLHLYKAIEPMVWGRMVGRVNGANFTAIYGGTAAFGWKDAKLPAGHTWHSYLTFLLSTLPADTRASYQDKFQTSVDFWREKGGCLSDDTIAELKALGVRHEVGGGTNYKTTKKPVTFPDYPDDLDVTEFSSVPSYKRMAICILKNDHLCKGMGFSQTKQQTARRQAAIAKYMTL